MMGEHEAAIEMLAPIDQTTAAQKYQDIGMYGEYVRSRMASLFGEKDITLKFAEHQFKQFDAVQTNFSEVLVNLAMGNASLVNGRHVEAVGFLEKSLDIFENTRACGMFGGAILSLLAEAELASGNIERARALAERSVTFSVDRNQYWELQPWLVQARSASMCGDRETVIDTLEELQSIIDRTGAVIYRPYLDELRAN